MQRVHVSTSDPPTHTKSHHIFTKHFLRSRQVWDVSFFCGVEVGFDFFVSFDVTVAVVAFGLIFFVGGVEVIFGFFVSFFCYFCHCSCHCRCRCAVVVVLFLL